MAKYQKIDDSYIGRGAFGSVSRVRRISDGRIVACKTIQFFNNQVKKSAVRDECEILKTLQHPNIVRFYDVQWDAFQARLYMENCEGGNLDQFVGKHHGEENWPSEKDVWRVTFQLAAAIAYCHEGILRKPAGGFYTDVDPGPWRTIWHRDIKPENVFVRQYPDGEIAVKLGDFGLGVILFDEHEKFSYGGTNQYIPAEEVTRTSPSWSNKSDIFSFGCTLHFLCVGRPPFGSHLTMEAQSTTGQLEFPNRFSDNLRRLTHSCFVYLPADRPEAREVFEEAEGHVDNRDLQRVTLSPAGAILGDALPTALLPKGPDKKDAQIPSPRPTAKELECDHAIQLTNGISTLNVDPSMRGKSEELSGNNDVEHRSSRRLSDLPVAASKSDLALPSISHSAPSSQGASSTPSTMVPAKVSADTFFQIPRSVEPSSAQRTSGPPYRSDSPLSSIRSKSTGTSYIVDFSHENFEKALVRNLGAFICGLPNQYPHFSVYYDLSDSSGHTRKIHAETLTRAVAVSDSIKEEVQDAPVGTKSRSLFGLRKKSEKSVLFNTTSIRLEASQCNEYLLLNNEEWISNSRTWRGLEESRKTVIWLKSRLTSPKKVYLIMGYLTYMNPKVSKENDSQTGSHNSSYAALSIPTGEGATARSPSQQSFVSGQSLSSGQNFLELDGERVQAGFFREVTLQFSLNSLDHYNAYREIRLGDPITVYFWGPRKRPL